jgi:CheY-like chemotaxis protein
MSKSTNTKFQAIMLIDDNEIDNLINQKMIEASGISEHIFVHSGAKSAIEFLKNMEKLFKAGAGFLPDIIFLDIDMPLMDGFQFLDEYEKMSEELKQHAQIVMLTSSLNPADMQKAKKNQYITKFLNKPLSSETLQKL